ncbi:MAG: hypothetical protein HUU46_05030 [Candidatus Hydrogenedentes bacterium]|nr:hypothetical protein [Candidatus Hydrogenedentota bacterium]
MKRSALALGKKRVSGQKRGFPAAWMELAAVDVGFGGDAQEGVARVGKRIESVAFGGLDEGVVDGGSAVAAV